MYRLRDGSWLIYVYCWRVIWVKLGKLMLEIWALDFPEQLHIRAGSAHILTNLSKSKAITLQEFSATSLHEPNFKVCICRERVEEWLSRAWKVICSENWLIKFFFEGQGKRHIESLEICLRHIFSVNQNNTISSKYKLNQFMLE